MTNRVRAERAMLRITQEELARRVNVSRQTISSIEGGKYAPSTVLALKIARILGKTVEDLFILEESDWP